MKVSHLFFIGLAIVALMNGESVRQAVETNQQESAIQSNFKQAVRNDKNDEREALRRARRCLLIDERYPIVEGGKAYYDMTNRQTQRLLPTDTVLCSAGSGITAIVTPEGTLTDLRSAPVERIREVLRERGLIK